MGNFPSCGNCDNGAGPLQYWPTNRTNAACVLANEIHPNCTDVTSPSDAATDVFCINESPPPSCGLERYRDRDDRAASGEQLLPTCNYANPDEYSVFRVEPANVPDPSVCSTSGCMSSPYAAEGIFFYPDACCGQGRAAITLPLCSAATFIDEGECCRTDNSEDECGLVEIAGGGNIDNNENDGNDVVLYSVFRVGSCPPTTTTAATPPATPPAAPPATPASTPAPTTDPLACEDDVVCKPGVCFKAIPEEECPTGKHLGMEYFFEVHHLCNEHVPVGALCEGGQECGTNNGLNNCKFLDFHQYAVNLDVYRRVECCAGTTTPPATGLRTRKK